MNDEPMQQPQSESSNEAPAPGSEREPIAAVPPPSEPTQSGPSLAQTVLLTSGVTLLIVAAVLYSFRAPLAAFVAEAQPVTFTPRTETASTAVSQPPDAIADMIEQVNPAVVSVVVTKDVPVYERYYEEFRPWGFWGGSYSVPRLRQDGTEEREIGGGSGFIVSPEGHIVTNRHVVDDESARYTVFLNDGRSFPVEVLARDPQLDIAVLAMTETEGEQYTHVSFGDSTSLRLGQTVVAIGNALAEFRNSVSVGVVSGLSRSITASDSFGRSEQLDQVIQTDAAINPGNSGGPLLNLAGEVIGVNVATSRGAENISFALPAHVVAAVVESVQETGEIVRPFLGVRYAMVTERMQTMNNLEVDYGALVIRGEDRDMLAVMPGSPADRAGIRENDIILAIDDTELRDVDLATVLRRYAPGDTIAVRLLQAGEERTISVTLVESPSE